MVAGFFLGMTVERTVVHLTEEENRQKLFSEGLPFNDLKKISMKHRMSANFYHLFFF